LGGALESITDSSAPEQQRLLVVVALLARGGVGLAELLVFLRGRPDVPVGLGDRPTKDVGAFPFFFSLAIVVPLSRGRKVDLPIFLV
jgi:hypothetical protein